MPPDKMFIRKFIIICTFVFHSVLFRKSFKLSVPEHWQTRHSNHHYGNTKIFIPFAKLVYCSFFIRVAHKIYVTFKYFGIEFECVNNQLSVLCIFFFHHHMHECAVVNSVHTKCTYEVTFHQPESFCH